MIELIIDSLKSALIYPFYKPSTYNAIISFEGFSYQTFAIFIGALLLGHILNYTLGSCLRGILKDDEQSSLNEFLSSKRFKLFFILLMPLTVSPLAGGFVSLSAGLLRTNKLLTFIAIIASLAIYYII